MSLSTSTASLLLLDSASCMYICTASYSAATMKRMALMSSSFVSLRLFANPEKGDPNSGMSFLLFVYEWFIKALIIGSDRVHAGVSSDLHWRLAAWLRTPGHTTVEPWRALMIRSA